MTTPFNTVAALFPYLTVEQQQAVEAYTASLYRQNLVDQITVLPNASLPSIGLFINTFTNPTQVAVPLPPVLENAVPAPLSQQLFPDLPPSPLVIAEGENVSQKQSHKHPQLKPHQVTNITCPGCIGGDELSAWTHTWAEGCEGFEGHDEDDNDELDDDLCGQHPGKCGCGDW